ncbi:MAG: cyclic nucleotide-binding domain-containing protein [bacterium]|nr:cyclic nucleotide-binding domain-containing protein [bacterium]
MEIESERVSIREFESLRMTEGFDAQERAAFAEICVRRRYDDGETLFVEAEGTRDLFVLVRGTIRIAKTDAQGRSRTLASVAKAGAVFGEIALLLGDPRTATGTAVGELETIVVDPGRFDALIDDGRLVAYKFALNILKDISRRQAAMNETTLRLMGRLGIEHAGMAETVDDVTRLREKLLLNWNF